MTSPEGPRPHNQRAADDARPRRGVARTIGGWLMVVVGALVIGQAVLQVMSAIVGGAEGFGGRLALALGPAMFGIIFLGFGLVLLRRPTRRRRPAPTAE